MKKVDLIVNFKIQNSILIARLSKKTKKKTLSLLAADIILHKDAVKMVVWKTEANPSCLCCNNEVQSVGNMCKDGTAQASWCMFKTWLDRSNGTCFGPE